MSEWKTYRLGDICSRIKSGKGIPASKVSPTGKYPVIGGNGIRGYTDTSNFKGDCAVVGRQGAYCGNVRFFTGEAYMTEHAVVIVGNELADTKYLAYLLSIMQLGHLSAQSAQPGLSVQTLSKLSIDIPDLSTQQQIAAILGALDDKIELNRRINANLEEQAQALFKSWFVDFEPFRDGPFVDSELGKIPKGWKVEVLSNFAKVTKKGISPSVSETYNHYSIPAYDDAQFPEKQSGRAIKSGKYIVYDNSVLLSKLNPRIKRLWFIKAAEENAICSTEFIPIQTKNNDLISFVFYLIDSDIFYQQALSLANGATGSHQRFHVEDIMQIPFAWNEDIAIGFAQKTNCILQKIEDNIRENQTLSALRDTLLPKLMAGEIAIE